MATNSAPKKAVTTTKIINFLDPEAAAKAQESMDLTIASLASNGEVKFEVRLNGNALIITGSEIPASLEQTIPKGILTQIDRSKTSDAKNNECAIEAEGKIKAVESSAETDEEKRRKSLGSVATHALS